MKILTLGTIIFCILKINLSAQIINGSFEINEKSSLEGWEHFGGFLCQDAPPGGGKWSIELSGGCVWGYISQNFPQIKNNETWRLSCWAKRIGSGGGNILWFNQSPRYSLKSIPVSDTFWTFLSFDYTFPDWVELVAVALEGGGGFASSGGARFDLIKVEKINPTTPVINPSSHSVQDFTLYQNYPNPFNSMTVIRYEMNLPSFVELSIYNLFGQKIRNLISEWEPSGIHQTSWDGLDASGNPVSSGIYFYRIIRNSFLVQKKAVILR